MIKNVIFDLDTTLTDTLFTIAESRTWLIAELHRTTGISKSLLMSEMRPLLVESIHDYRIFQKLPSIQKKIEKGELSASTLKIIESNFHEVIALNSSLIEGVKSVLDTLHEEGYSLFLVSNKRMPFVRKSVVDLGIESYFKAIYTRMHEEESLNTNHRKKLFRPFSKECKKPSKKLQELIISEQNIQPSKTVIVGNNLKNDGGLSLDSEIKFVHFIPPYPQKTTQDKIYRLTKNEALSYGAGGVKHPEYKKYLGKVKIWYSITDIKELLKILELKDIE